MRPIDIERFSSIASQSPITDVLLAIERSGNGSDGEWTSLEGGPILLCFDDHCAVLRQPVGRSSIELLHSSLDEWHALIKQDYPECVTGLMSIFDAVCYPENRDSTSPRASRVIAFEQRDTNALSGMIVELSTGGSISVDAYSYGGLVWFLDGQLSIFRRQCVDAMSLQEKIVWTR